MEVLKRSIQRPLVQHHKEHDCLRGLLKEERGFWLCHTSSAQSISRQQRVIFIVLRYKG